MEVTEATSSLLLILLLKRKEKRKQNRRWWIRPLNRTRSLYGFEVSFEYMKINDPEQFFIYTRMNVKQFDDLLELLNRALSKKSIRTPLNPQCRLAITLLHLSQGASYQTVAWCFKIGKSTAREIILDTSNIIWNNLKDLYVKEPSCIDYKNITHEFQEKWNLPNVLGSIDGKHIAIQSPPNSGSEWYNYKGFYSINLLAICDADYNFTMIDVGTAGSENDSAIFRETSFGKKIYNNKMNLPASQKLPNTDIEFPYYFIGDGAFPLRQNLMRPFPGRFLPGNKRVFNYRLSRARRTIENTFGILVNRWRILKNAIIAYPENAVTFVLATVALHNYIKKTNAKQYCPTSFVDSYGKSGELVLGQWRSEIAPLNSVRLAHANNSATDAFRLRDIICNYLNTTGSVPWQNNYA